MKTVKIQVSPGGQEETVEFPVEIIKSWGHKSVAHGMPGHEQIHLFGPTGYVALDCSDQRSREQLREEIKSGTRSSVQVGSSILAIRVVLTEKGLPNESFRKIYYDRVPEANLMGRSIVWHGQLGIKVHNPGSVLSILAPGNHPDREVTQIRFQDLRDVDTKGLKVRVLYLVGSVIHRAFLITNSPATAQKVKHLLDTKTAHYLEVNDQVLVVVVQDPNRSDSFLLFGIRNLITADQEQLKQYGLEEFQAKEYGGVCHRLHKENIEAAGVDWR